MSKHAGPHVEKPPHVVYRKRLLALGLGVTLAIVAWGYLVTAAVHFGSEGRDGESSAWLFLAFATIGATACFFGMLILASKVLATLRGDVPAPRTPGGGRRASR